MERKTEEVIWTTVYHMGLDLVKVTLKLEARFLCKNTSNQPENGREQGGKFPLTILRD